MTGKLSKTEIGSLQLGQCEAGLRIDKLFGILQIMTLRNEPIARPKNEEAIIQKKSH